ncbi:hypothetical protein ABL78_1302 [Leptomonas seymouri]|uniref:Uncharacterized protein n=1 Tax=Leptomonas seymouri TaxID=5684 RepID=A0A0N1I7K7_LEPSE|nr:hypothetical protein ABL78_1302 [Leptomonas seymouri]|eukprot:KPI89534.1 hypothetical protein ABL78_1302 [Leptomonas seymouri]
MYRVFPSLILRAAMVRARSLDLCGVNDYYASSSAPSSSTLVAAAPSATNVYVLAYGEREGLAPGERLEVYGSDVRLVRTLAYGCPRGITVQSAFTGRLSEDDLKGITEQLDALHPCGTDMGKLTTRHLQQHVSSTSSSQQVNKPSAPSSPTFNSAKTPNAADAGQRTRRSHEWALRLPDIKGSSVLRSSLPDDTSSLSGEKLAAQLERMHRSPEEVVVAEWIRHKGGDEQKKTKWCDASENEGSNGEAPINATPLTGTDIASLPPRQKPGISNENVKSSEEDCVERDALLMENGVCFRSVESCGLRALRTARLAFISNIERMANGLARRQSRLSGDELRALEVLDVSAIDFTFTNAALQTTLELGLHTGEACRITHVPLTDAAAQRVEPQAASYVRVVAADAGRALPRPFDFMPTRSFDVSAYTAYLPLPLGPLTKADAADSAGSSSSSASPRPARSNKNEQRPHQRSHRPYVEAGIGGSRLDRQQLAMQLSQAMATLRRGACMLVTFVPTPSTVAALYNEMETQHHTEVLIEQHMVANSKACIAEAISRTGRWGYITDEVLPAVDSPQGSSFSLVVVLE